MITHTNMLLASQTQFTYAAEKFGIKISFMDFDTATKI